MERREEGGREKKDEREAESRRGEKRLPSCSTILLI